MINIVFIVGVSGSGKSYIKDKLIEYYPNQYDKIIQYTTRNMRDGEINGKDYNFISKEKYNEIKENLFCKTEINGNLYGTPVNFNSNKIILLVVNSSGITDGINFINNFNEKYNYLILDINNSDPVKRIDRDKKFVIEERNDLNNILLNFPKDKIIRLENNSKNYLKAKDVNDILLFYLKKGK